MLKHERSGIGGLALLFAVALALVALPVGAAVTVTAVEGDAKSESGDLLQHKRLESGDDVETEGEGRCSLLLAEDAVVQLCNEAKLRFRDEGPRGPSVLDLLRGEMKATVGPRPSDDPLEIHTPVAIATILGTIAHVYVDPVTGDAVFTSLEGRIGIAAKGAPEKAVVIAPGEQVAVKSGRLPGRVQRLDPTQLARLSDCIDDDDLRRAAATLERLAGAGQTLDEIVMMDVPEDDLPGVAAPGLSPLVRMTADPTLDFDAVCYAGSASCNVGLLEAAAEGTLLLPDPCGGIPGEQCTRR